MGEESMVEKARRRNIVQSYMRDGMSANKAERSADDLMIEFQDRRKRRDAALQDPTSKEQEREG